MITYITPRLQKRHTLIKIKCRILKLLPLCVCLLIIIINFAIVELLKFIAYEIN